MLVNPQYVSNQDALHYLLQYIFGSSLHLITNIIDILIVIGVIALIVKFVRRRRGGIKKLTAEEKWGGTGNGNSVAQSFDKWATGSALGKGDKWATGSALGVGDKWADVGARLSVADKWSAILPEDSGSSSVKSTKKD